MLQRVTLLLHFELNWSLIEYIQKFNFLGFTLNSSLCFKFHLTKIGNKVSRVIVLLHKLKHISPSYILRMKSIRPEVRGTTDFYGGAYPPSKTSPSYAFRTLIIFRCRLTGTDR